MKSKCRRNSSADFRQVAAAVNIAAVQLLRLQLLLLPVLLLLLLIAAAVAEVQLACQLTRF